MVQRYAVCVTLIFFSHLDGALVTVCHSKHELLCEPVSQCKMP